MQLITVWIQRYDEWVQALFTHLQISMIALIFSMLIAIPLAIIIKKYQKLSEIVLQTTGIFQTIPSLAILGLLIPILGIGKIPAIITLAIYGVFPILQNTITGFYQIEKDYEEAATAFGMNFKEKLFRYQLPLALPVIVAGVRASAVMIIGTATLAALIGAGGLGSFILLGIDRNQMDLILIGAISAAVLAIMFNVIIKKMEKMKLKKMLVIFSILVIGSFSTLIPTMMNNKKIVIAGKLGSEPEILLHMYKYLIEEESDIHVEVKPNFGKTIFLYEALKNKSIDIYPEFSGTITSTLLKNNSFNSTDEKEVYTYAKDEIFKQDNLIYLKPMQYQNTYALAVKRVFAEKYNLKNISDLKKIKDFKVGLSLEFNDRKDGGIGLKEKYGLDLDIVTMEPSLKYNALNNNQVDVVEVYSTDSEIKAYDLVLLNDDLKLFPPYQGAPLLRKETLDKYPKLEKILNKLENKISEIEMAEMNYLVKEEKQDASKVAYDYLVKNKLIGEK